MFDLKCCGQSPRSLEFIAHPKFNTWRLSNPLPLIVKLRLVRALDLLKVKLPSSWAAAVQSLTHLKYLAISVKEFDFKWISHLQDLQTLDARKFIRTSGALENARMFIRTSGALENDEAKACEYKPILLSMGRRQ
ncbi:hypothetical protein RND71_004970 [Anisodus tanguticus]|uniref:Uncharacterized protein n=1 Tax=Anisodus tanguticus TaxID=243964 RepID=A0AAE1SN26_9SOLA|nr:hypothetical protein RND71_004970 [Anisodus tanguticus]